MIYEIKSLWRRRVAVAIVTPFAFVIFAMAGACMGVINAMEEASDCWRRR